jgi:hypothetical protein
MKCSAVTCQREAQYAPVIHFSSKVNPTARGQMRLALPVCSQHTYPQPSAYVSDAGWAQIENTFEEAGMAEPDRKTLTVTFVPLT